jgi:hypothetical protein
MKAKRAKICHIRKAPLNLVRTARTRSDNFLPAAKMPLDSGLKTLCDYLRRRLEMDVAVGRPNETAPGMYVWPWRIVPTTESRNVLPHQEPSRGIFRFRVNCLLLITPADTLETVAKLDLAAQAIHENPILEDARG